MSVPKEYEQEFAGFPAVLQALVLAELSAGNTIKRMSHGHPAAPCGACICLSKPISSQPREKTLDLDFYDRNNSLYAGEFTDATRHFFVLEPPRPSEPPPDMNAIRAQMYRSYAEANGIPLSQIKAEDAGRSWNNELSPEERIIRAKAMPDPNSVLARFKASMIIDYDKWHDGIGYDLDLLAQASPDELRSIEDMLINRSNSDWRDVEALAALNTNRAKEALKQAFNAGSSAVQMAVHSYAPEVMTKQQRTASLVKVLLEGDRSGGLSQALMHVGSFHPPQVITALLRGLMEQDGGTACHFAAMLYFLHGKSTSTFDWDHRPFFLRFNTDDMKEREIVVRELCATIGVDPDRCFK
jgi:hypothetical protein